MSIEQKIRGFVEEESKKPTSKYGYEPFEFHFVFVVKYAKKLAKELGADEEIVAIAGWLHDIGSIVYGRKDHHITGAKIAVEKLTALGYPADKIELVEKCILHHRGSRHDERKTLEEKIIAEADAMSAFDNIPGVFKAAFVYEHNTQGEAKESVRNKLKNKFNQLYFKNSKKIIKPKYKAAMLLLE